MIITTSNILLGKVPTIFTGGSTDVPANLTDPDFSTIYKSSDSLRLTYDFGLTGVINYVAVAGINIGSGKHALIKDYSRVRVYDGLTLIKTVNTIRDNCVVVFFEDRQFINLRVGLKNSAGINPICSFTAAGTAFVVPNSGEHAGYNRQALNRSYKQKTTTNTMAAPTAVLTKDTVAKGALSLPNMTRAFSEDTWQDFLDFSRENFFFIQEVQNNVDTVSEDLNASSYLCHNVRNNKVTAHSQTRALNDISISFSVFNGL